MKQQLINLLTQSLQTLQTNNLLPENINFVVNIERTKNKNNGNFACNVAMMLAKKANIPPKELAQLIVAHIPNNNIIDKVKVAEPGFINFFQKHDLLIGTINSMLASSELLTTKAVQRIVLDISSPNLAKEMHVGHLRSTIIGDAVARMHEYIGNYVIRQNHVGDWGTQFGMLLAYLEDTSHESQLSDLEGFYRDAKQLFDKDKTFADKARNKVVELQQGNIQAFQLWKHFTNISLKHCQEIYDLLNVKLLLTDVKGESSYNDMLPAIINKLKDANMLVEDAGALCVFLQEFKNSDGNMIPLIVQKQDGGYLYATTDLAAAQYRSEKLQADKVLYFVDARQSLHLAMVFATAKQSGIINDNIHLEHCPFGTLNDQYGKPFKTRDGGTIKLINLITEAKERAMRVAESKNQTLSLDELKIIADAIAINSIKYADLSKHRTSDYNFNFDLMLSFDGNTAPYIMYAYTRTQSILRRFNDDYVSYKVKLVITQLSSIYDEVLAVKLSQFSEVLSLAIDKSMPHILCTYIYELTGEFSKFYEHTNILKETDEQIQNSRLSLIYLTGNVIKDTMQMLGMKVIERM